MPHINIVTIGKTMDNYFTKMSKPKGWDFNKQGCWNIASGLV